MSENKTFAYDKILYPNYLHTQTHPDRLATMTKFFGMNPKPIENCRVLELGCGTGSSLWSFAYDLKDSEFIGIDLSGKQIEIGNRAVSEIGIKNLKLLQGDIMQVTREKFGEFDYIIAHGLYSWVPDFVRDQIMKICRETLAEQGVALISYNTYPGCFERKMVREMMLYHTRNIVDPKEKVDKSLTLMNFLVDSAKEDFLYKKVLEIELEQLKSRNMENIFHDDLAEINHPVYFHEFVDHARQFGLKFVTEVEHFNSKYHTKEFLDALEDLSENQTELEQNLDFIKGRRFRQSLLCHEETKLNSQPNSLTIRELYISSASVPETDKIELATNKREKFLCDDKRTFEIEHHLTKAALVYLGKIWARSITFEQLVKEARNLISEETGKTFEPTEDDVETLNEILFGLFSSGLLRLGVHEPEYCHFVSNKPKTSPIARWQIENSDSISTLFSTGLVITDSVGKRLVKLLDGTRDREQIKNDLTEFINSPDCDRPQEIKDQLLQNFPEHLENNLQGFARMGLLIS